MIDLAAPQQASLTFSKIHLDEFRLRQMRSENPKKVIRALGTTYALDANGKRVYGQPFQAKTDDVHAALVGDYINRTGTNVETAISTLEGYKAQIAAQHQAGTVDDLWLMAAFEIAIARILERFGGIDVAGV